MSGEILRIANENPRAVGVLTRGIQKAVVGSFAADYAAGTKTPPTDHEQKRRVRMCMDIARVLKGDLNLSVDRIVSELPTALRAKLDGLPWDPTKVRTLFVASAEDPLAKMLRELKVEKIR